MCGYAIDMNGILVDGVIVEKDQARQVFEEEARSIEQSSVSIVEAIQGNVFKASFVSFQV